MFKRIDHVEIIPRDVEQTIDFYVNILGFKVKSRHEMDRPPMKEIVYLELGDTVIELIAAENPSPKSIHWVVNEAKLAISSTSPRSSKPVTLAPLKTTFSVLTPVCTRNFPPLTE